MQPKNSHFEIPRLLSLGSQVQVDLSTPLSGLADEPETAINSRVASACQLLLSTLASRGLPPPAHEAAEKWGRIAVLLAAIEQLSGRELSGLDESAKLACAAARSRIEELPAMLQATACASVATLTPNPGDLAPAGVKRLAGRLRRQILFNVRAVVNQTASQLQADLLRQLAEAVNTLYSLAVTCDEMVRAALCASSDSQGTQVCGSLAEKLTKRRDQLRSGGNTPGGGHARDYAFGLGVGALSNALCGFAPASLESFPLTGLPAKIGVGQGLQEFKQSALAAIQSLLAREWQSRQDGVLESVYGHIVGCFAELKLDIDSWFQEAQRSLSAFSGRPIDAEQITEAVRFEVLAICRQAELQRSVTA